MRRIGLLGLTVAVLGLVSAGLSSVAQAALGLLPGGGGGGEGITMKIKGGGGGGSIGWETLGGKKVECNVVEGVAKSLHDDEGEIELKYKECKEPALGTTCTGLADTSGNITIPATYYFRYLLPSTGSGVNLAILIGQVHFSCSLVLVLVSGCYSSADATPLSTLTKELKINFLEEKGDQKPTEIDNKAGTAMESCVLKMKFGSGAEESAALFWNETVSKFEQGGKAIEVLLMI